MQSIWSFILDKLHIDESVMLIVVTEVRGSSPGKKGFKMAVSKRGEKHGTIGGGPMEYSLEKVAMDNLSANSPKAFTRRLVHSADAGEEASGLICAGEQHHAFVKLTPEDRPTIVKIASTLSEGHSGWLSIYPDGLQFNPSSETVPPDHSDLPADIWKYEELLSPLPVFCIFGGGHVSMPVTQIARILGFRVEVYDNREKLPTLVNNPHAEHKRIISYENASAQIKAPDNTFVCIMTVSHASDQIILEQMLSLPLRYLGMIGSRKKVNTIFENLRGKGIPDEALSRVNAPMGMAINSETPVEIAVSIMAEVIKRKNQPR